MNLESLSQNVHLALGNSGMEVLEEHTVAASAGSYAPAPQGLVDSLQTHLVDQFGDGLYSHQGVAINAVLNGADVCLATPTASGKSLVFMSVASDLILKRPGSTVLALYPIKALIQDQVSKWSEMLKPLGLQAGFIDGSVDTSARQVILRNSDIVLMTPDVLQAWFMGNLKKKEVASFAARLKYLILDEAHVYSGVFGSNMAYLLRRLQAVSGLERIITSTATIGEPQEFVERLTGRAPVVISETDDTAPKPAKSIVLADAGSDSFKNLVRFIVELSKSELGTFIAFGDSRRLVETFVAATRRYRSDINDDEVTQDENEEQDPEVDVATFEAVEQANILPYRAGYEEEDRRAIQRALEKGELKGVVATSGLELGIDIGDVNAVIMLGTPPSIQAFRQRLGRVGRKNDGICVLVDTKGVISATTGGLGAYMQRAPEKGWLYLDNRYIQYTNALCAAVEVESGPGFNSEPFKSLPAKFIGLVNNELEPTEQLPQDFFALKQRAQNGPHYEFPVRSGIEKSYSVRLKQGPNIQRLGTLTHSQMLREGFPGAVYYYMARPYRVYAVNHRQGEIDVRREGYFTTQPITQNMVFPKFPNGALSLLKSSSGFVAEAELQVSERVLGLIQTRGSKKDTFTYAPGSQYAEKPITRMFETTGVCWSIPNTQLMTEPLAIAIQEAFCQKYGIHSRDIGIGTFHTNCSPLGGVNCKGICIYDATNGSLRLTQQLADNFGDVLDEAVKLIESHDTPDVNLGLSLGYLKECFLEMEESTFDVGDVPGAVTETAEWVEVFAIGERVLYKNNGDHKEVFVKGYRFTPAGLMYELGNESEKYVTKSSEVLAASDVTKTVQYNLYTGDIRQFASG